MNEAFAPVLIRREDVVFTSIYGVKATSSLLGRTVHATAKRARDLSLKSQTKTIPAPDVRGA